MTPRLLSPQTEWHTEAKTLTSLFLRERSDLYTKSGVNALDRRGFEVEDDVVGQNRFSTTTSGINWTNVRGAFVVGNKLYYADTSGALFSATWSQTANAPVAGTVTQLVTAGTGWASRALFPLQAVRHPCERATRRRRVGLLRPAQLHLRRLGVDRSRARSAHLRLELR